MQNKYLVTKNIFYNFGGQITLLLLGVFTTPFVIHHLGNELYAILSLLYVIIGYLSVLDLGLGISIVKYISEYEAKSDSKTLEKIIGTALTIYLIIGLVGAGLIFVFTNFLVNRFLQIPSEIIPTALTVFYLSGLGFFVNMVLTVFNSVPNALQRMDIANGRNILFGALNTLGIVILLLLEQGIIAVVAWNIAVSLIATIVFIGIVKKMLPGISFKLSFDKVIFYKLVNFGGFKSISNIGGQIVFQLDKLLIGVYFPIAIISYYIVPNILVQKGLSLMLNVTSAIFPAMSKYIGLKDEQKVHNLYFRMTKLIILIMFPVLALLFIYSHSVLAIWVGPEYADKGSLVLKILSVAYFVAALSAPGVVATDAAGKPYLSALFAAISAAINLIAAIILIPKFGIEGAAWAQLINFTTQVPIFLAIVHSKVIKVSNYDVIRKSFLKPLTAGVLTSLTIVLINNYLSFGVMNVILGGLIFCSLYIFLNILIGTFNELDKAAVFHFAKKFTYK